jgi:uncharacterized protein
VTTAVRLRAAVFAAVLFGAALGLAAQEAPIPPAPARWVTDTAGFLSSGTVASLDARLQDYERRTGHQVLVYIGKSTGMVPLDDWAVRAFEAWKVGRKGLDDGLVLFIMAEDRRIRIEVGYGLEDKVPDIRAYRIINGILVPGIQNGRNDAAVTDAVSGLLSLIEGGAGAEAAPPESGNRPAARAHSPFNTILAVAAVIFFLILLITHPTLALWLLLNIFTGGRGGGGGGWGGGGGGFSGGGGRSGGGGASGSW